MNWKFDFSPDTRDILTVDLGADVLAMRADEVQMSRICEEARAMVEMSWRARTA